MSVQQRSKSAPQLAVSLAFQTPGDDSTQSPIHRRQQSFVNSPVISPSASRPRDEPFALSGFFPSYMSPLKESEDGERWKWLRGDEEEDAESAYTASEEDPTVPPTPVGYDESENPDRVIQREDKLGVLRLLHFLEEGQPKPQPTTPQPEQGLAIEAPLKLLYLEQNVDSFEDMCDTFRARRQARDRGLSINTKEIAKGLSTGPLFSPTREETESTEEDWDDVLYRGWQRVTDLLF